LRAKWTFESPLAKRNNQERVNSFFNFCLKAGILAASPAAQLSTIQVKADETNDVQPLEPQQYEKLIKAVAKCNMTERNAARFRARMKLQRWSGLSLVDAVLACQG
jgi:hypothetical protein